MWCQILKAQAKVNRDNNNNNWKRPTHMRNLAPPYDTRHYCHAHTYVHTIVHEKVVLRHMYKVQTCMHYGRHWFMQYNLQGLLPGDLCRVHWEQALPLGGLLHFSVCTEEAELNLHHIPHLSHNPLTTTEMLYCSCAHTCSPAWYTFSTGGCLLPKWCKCPAAERV